MYQRRGSALRAAFIRPGGTFAKAAGARGRFGCSRTCQIGRLTGITGAIFAGWLSTRVGRWKVYAILGWTMIAVMLGFAYAPRTAVSFLVVELLYRALASGCYAALLGIVMTAIGKGAASTKAAAFWSFANFATVYPALIEGSIHDSAGTRAMLLTDAALGAAGFGVLLIAYRVARE